MSAMNPRTGWSSAAERMLRRIDHNLGVLKSEFPHWADSQSGVWTTALDGDWTGGAWPGQLWLAARRTGEARYLNAARQWSNRLRLRARLQTAFKGFGFYYGAALGQHA
jgi:unsaturated chondroitin disaccharide hydrolase